MTYLPKSQRFIKENLEKIINMVSNFLILFDWDGVFTSTERMSHYAAYNVLCSYEQNSELSQVLNRKDFSDHLFGVKVIHQREKMEEYFSKNSISVTFPEDFESLRDKEQNAMFKGLEMVKGMYELGETLKKLNFKLAIASRSRLDPFLRKYYGTNADKFVLRKHCFTAEEMSEDSNKIVGTVLTDIKLPAKDWEFDKVKIFSYACAEMYTHPQNTIVIEDSVKGIISAQKIGAYPLCFLGAEDTDNESTRKQLKGILPEEQICENADELLLAILKKLIEKL